MASAQPSPTGKNLGIHKMSVDPGEDDPYNAPTKVGELAGGAIQNMFADADVAEAVSQSKPPPAESDIRPIAVKPVAAQMAIPTPVFAFAVESLEARALREEARHDGATDDAHGSFDAPADASPDPLAPLSSDALPATNTLASSLPPAPWPPPAFPFTMGDFTPARARSFRTAEIAILAVGIVAFGGLFALVVSFL